LPFYTLAQELYPGKYRPTITHSFIRLLYEKGLLLKLFTQNIDCLEREAGVPEEYIVEAHGSFARCVFFFYFPSSSPPPPAPFLALVCFGIRIRRKKKRDTGQSLTPPPDNPA
jgi:hypothetical protein